MTRFPRRTLLHDNQSQNQILEKRHERQQDRKDRKGGDKRRQHRNGRGDHPHGAAGPARHGGQPRRTSARMRGLDGHDALHRHGSARLLAEERAEDVARRRGAHPRSRIPGKDQGLADDLSGACRHHQAHHQRRGHGGRLPLLLRFLREVLRERARRRAWPEVCRHHPGSSRPGSGGHQNHRTLGRSSNQCSDERQRDPSRPRSRGTDEESGRPQGRIGRPDGTRGDGRPQ